MLSKNSWWNLSSLIIGVTEKDMGEYIGYTSVEQGNYLKSIP